MADTDYKVSGTASAETGWSSFTTTRLNSSDNSRASQSFNNYYGYLSDFTFGVPGSATIEGILVEVEGRSSLPGTNNYAVSLSWNGGSTYTTAKTDSFTSTTDAVDNLGGSTDTWERSWTDAEFSNANFRLRICRTSGTFSLEIDRIRIVVYYSEGVVTVGAQSVTFNQPTPVIAGKSLVTTTVQSATFSQIDPALSFPVNHYADPLSVTFNQINPTLAYGYAVSPSVQTITLNQINPSILAGNSVFVDAQNVTFSQPNPTFTYGYVLGLSAQNLSINQLDPTISTSRSGIWEEISSTSTSWDKASPATGSWSKDSPAVAGWDEHSSSGSWDKITPTETSWD